LFRLWQNNARDALFMTEVADGRTLIEKIRSDIRRDGQSMVSRKDWLALCSNDLSCLGVIASNENWNYELVGDATMRFTAAALRPSSVNFNRRQL
jgi:hypothetical protein